ncbi:PTS sugar transporter subunit IIC [Paenibacillus sp. 23TSA30-6]|uniref:PTS sugar transporter subunit IIC n=1 Tax=Paenibacillus sp. 23TSA30-6 TaxID=2546104 RepID=UPI0017877DF4|nr:PTS transporter subunit EIIC [Paenibacillus sp. 23TSA30-6]MBE0339684.1 PTS sugar transporter subunit IIC [Paenibacillus sp. 23TSA30-6]
MSFKDNFERVISRSAEAVDQNKYLSVIKAAFSQLLPLIMIGSFSTLLTTLIADPKTGLAKWLPFLTNLKPAFDVISFATISCMAIPLIFLIGLSLGKRNGVSEITSGILAIICYILVVPSFVTMKAEDGTILKTAGLATSALGAEGLLVGMLVSVLAIEIFTFLMNFEKIKIKMPDQVPPMVATSFNSLIPVFLTTTIIAILGVLFQLATGKFINEFIYSVVQAPLQNVFQSPFGVVIVIIVMQLLWFLGIHGGQATSPIKNPLMAVAIAANVAAVSQGMDPTQPITFGFWRCFVAVGGAGMIISLVFAIILVSKRPEHKTLAKLGFLPSICGISEPLVFGLPLVLNVTFIIPLVFNSCISALIALFSMNIGFIHPNAVDVPFGVPILLNAFVSFGWQGVIVQAVCLIVTTLVWIPFVLISNKQARSAVTDDLVAAN